MAIVIAASLFKAAWKKPALNAWKPMLVALILFSVEELLGALRTFGVYSTPHLTHIVPSFILVFLIAALLTQININRGCVE